MKPNPILTTFNAPIHLRSKFDEICHLDGKTRTQVLIELMTDYVLTTGPKIVDKIRSIQSINLQPRQEQSNRPDRWMIAELPVWIDDGRDQC